MRGLIVAAFLLVAIPVAAQPATPCNPNSGTWAITTSSVAFYVCASDGASWLTVGGGGGSIPAGTITLILSGACPAGFEEATELAGKTIIGTTAAAKNVGTTGGADTITPQGVNTLAAVADHPSHTHTYNQVISHTHAVTSVGSAATGGTTNLTGASDTSSTTATAAAPAGSVATGTTAGPSATLTHSVTQPVFSGTQFDNRSAFTLVIFCKKT